MLRNNADACRCSYFELGLPVMEQACHKNTPHALWQILWHQEICCMTMTMQALACLMIKQPWLEHAAAMPSDKSRSNPGNKSWEQFCFKICAQRIEEETLRELNHLYGKPSNSGPGENSYETVHSVKCFRKKKGNTFRGNYLFLPSTSSRNFLPCTVPFFHKIKNQCQAISERKARRIRVNES